MLGTGVDVGAGCIGAFGVVALCVLAHLVGVGGGPARTARQFRGATGVLRRAGGDDERHGQGGECQNATWSSHGPFLKTRNWVTYRRRARIVPGRSKANPRYLRATSGGQ